MRRISRLTARRFLLAHQGLFPPRSLKGKEGILRFVQKVGCIQFDPLDIVGKNPELVLHSRIDDFSQEMLRELLYKDRLLLDGWDKQMSIYSLKDWASFSPARKRYREYYSDPSKPANAIVRDVRNEIGSLRRSLTQLIVGGTKLFFVRLSEDGPVERTFELFPDLTDVVGKSWCRFDWQFRRSVDFPQRCWRESRCWRGSRIERNLRRRLSVRYTYDKC